VPVVLVLLVVPIQLLTDRTTVPVVLVLLVVPAQLVMGVGCNTWTWRRFRLQGLPSGLTPPAVSGAVQRAVSGAVAS